jgi:tetratricopeptide (TPR) repeat protein
LGAEVALEAIVGGSVATVLDFITSSASTIAGTQSFKDWFSGCKTRLVAGSKQPANHDLVLGIRTAHLCAVDFVVRQHSLFLKQSHVTELSSDEFNFNNNVRVFLDERLKPISSGSVDHDSLTAGDISHVLDHLVHPLATGSYAVRASSARSAAISGALAEIEKDAGRPSPPLFKRVFEGDLGPGWYQPFSLFVAEQLKTNERFRAIFFTAELIDIKNIVGSLQKYVEAQIERHPNLTIFIEDVQARLARIEHKIDGIPAALLAALEKSGFIRKAEDDGLERRTILALARRLTSSEISDIDRAIAELEKAVGIAADVIARGERSSNETFFVSQVLATIARETTKGNFEIAASEIDRALADLTRREEEMKNELLRSRATLLEAGIEQDIFRRDAASVARRVDELASLTSDGIPGPWTDMYFARFDEYMTEGRYTALNFSLEIAASLARRSYDAARTNWEKGHAARLLADALCVLGQRELRPERLQQSVSAFSDALRFLAHEEFSWDWHSVLQDSTNALHQFGMRINSTPVLEAAVAAAREQVSFRRLVSDRVGLAGALTNLGATGQTLGGHIGSSSLLDEAVGSYSEALEYTPRQDAPWVWGLLQFNIGSMLYAQAKEDTSEGAKDKLRQSIEYYRNALLERTRERSLVDWQDKQGALAAALHLLGNRTGDIKDMEEAVAAYEEALTGCSKADTPYLYGNTQRNIARALVTLGSWKRDVALLRRALVARREAVDVFSRSYSPAEWADLQHEIGFALWTIFEMNGDRPSLLDAIDAYNEAQSVTDREAAPAHWADTQRNLALALRARAAQDKDLDGFHAAISAFRQCLEVQTLERFPRERADSMHQLGISITQMVDLGHPSDALPQAIEAFEQASLGRTQDRSTDLWAETRIGLGMAMMRHASEIESGPGLNDSLAVLEEVLAHLDGSRTPNYWSAAHLTIGTIYLVLGEQEQSIEKLQTAVDHLTRIDDFGFTPHEGALQAREAALASLANCRERDKMRIKD